MNLSTNHHSIRGEYLEAYEGVVRASDGSRTFLCPSGKIARLPHESLVTIPQGARRLGHGSWCWRDEPSEYGQSTVHVLGMEAGKSHHLEFESSDASGVWQIDPDTYVYVHGLDDIRMIDSQGNDVLIGSATGDQMPNQLGYYSAEAILLSGHACFEVFLRNSDSEWEVLRLWSVDSCPILTKADVHLCHPPAVNVSGGVMSITVIGIGTSDEDYGAVYLIEVEYDLVRRALNHAKHRLIEGWNAWNGTALVLNSDPPYFAKLNDRGGVSLVPFAEGQTFEIPLPPGYKIDSIAAKSFPACASRNMGTSCQGDTLWLVSSQLDLAMSCCLKA